MIELMVGGLGGGAGGARGCGADSGGGFAGYVGEAEWGVQSRRQWR